LRVYTVANGSVPTTYSLDDAVKFAHKGFDDAITRRCLGIAIAQEYYENCLRRRVSETYVANAMITAQDDPFVPY